MHFDELAISGIGFQALSTRWVKGTAQMIPTVAMEKSPSATAAIKLHNTTSKASQVYLTGFLFYFYQIRQHPSIQKAVRIHS